MALLVLGAGTLLPNSSLSFSRTLSEASLSTASSLSICFSALQRQPPPSPLVYCGRGDRKTAKGKRFNHSFGNARPRDKKKKGRGPPRAPMPPAPPRKDRFDDDEVVKIDIDESLFS